MKTTTKPGRDVAHEVQEGSEDARRTKPVVIGKRASAAGITAWLACHDSEIAPLLDRAKLVMVFCNISPEKLQSARGRGFQGWTGDSQFGPCVEPEDAEMLAALGHRASDRVAADWFRRGDTERVWLFARNKSFLVNRGKGGKYSVEANGAPSTKDPSARALELLGLLMDADSVGPIRAREHGRRPSKE